MKVKYLKQSWHKKVLFFALSFKFKESEFYDFQGEDMSGFVYALYVVAAILFALLVGWLIVLAYEAGRLLFKKRLYLVLLAILAS